MPTLLKEYDSYKRFQMDLEFVQLLANPDYLRTLVNYNYFEDVSFINYLHYLQYWKKPQYLKYIKYPMCLQILDCLQNPSFRENLQIPEYIDMLKKQIDESYYRLQEIGKQQGSQQQM